MQEHLKRDQSLKTFSSDRYIILFSHTERHLSATRQCNVYFNHNHHKMFSKDEGEKKKKEKENHSEPTWY